MGAAGNMPGNGASAVQTQQHPPLKVLCGMRYSGTFSARSVTLSLPMASASACNRRDRAAD